MKKHLPLFSFILLMAVIFTACSTGPTTPAQATTVSTAPAIDTAGFAKFQQWKAQNELAEMEAYDQKEEQPIGIPVAKAKKVYKAPVRSARSVAAVPRRKASTTKSSSASDKTGTSADGGSGTVMNNEGSDAAKAPEEKKGWSKAAKGTVIGAGGGAILGAVINKKNRAAGAVIGGVLGAGVGYGLGKVMDKKEANDKE